MLSRTLVALLLLLAAGRGAADEAGHAASQEQFQRGERAYAAAKFDEALEAFTAAYESEPRPEFLFNLGQCHRRLGHWEDARFFYRGYLERVPDAPDRAQVEALIGEMERQIAAPAPTVAPPPATAIEHGPSIARRWWFWTALAATLAVAATVTAVIITSNNAYLPGGKLGTFDVR